MGAVEQPLLDVDRLLLALPQQLAAPWPSRSAQDSCAACLLYRQIACEIGKKKIQLIQKKNHLEGVGLEMCLHQNVLTIAFAGP